MSKIPPPPTTVVSYDPFDRTPTESVKENATISGEDDMHEARTDRYFFANLSRTDRYGR